jgi:hypothetical protein
MSYNSLMKRKWFGMLMYSASRPWKEVVNPVTCSQTCVPCAGCHEGSVSMIHGWVGSRWGKIIAFAAGVRMQLQFSRFERTRILMAPLAIKGKLKQIPWSYPSEGPWPGNPINPETFAFDTNTHAHVYMH